MDNYLEMNTDLHAVVTLEDYLKFCSSWLPFNMNDMLSILEDLQIKDLDALRMLVRRKGAIIWSDRVKFCLRHCFISKKMTRQQLLKII